MIFDGVVCRRMYINNKHLVYTGWKAGIFYSMDVYGGNQVTNNVQDFVFREERFYSFYMNVIEELIQKAGFFNRRCIFEGMN